MNPLEKADKKLNMANQIIADLQLIERWSLVGKPFIVGATAYQLIYNPDIDMEIYCDLPEVASGFHVLEQCVRNPNVIGAKYSNHISGADQGIYYQLKYQDEDANVWKIDMWLMAKEHPGPCAKDLVEPLNRSLTDASREIILLIKEQIRLKGESIASIRIYESVIDHNIRTYEEFMVWHSKHEPIGLTFWKPREM